MPNIFMIKQDANIPVKDLLVGFLKPVLQLLIHYVNQECVRND